jgi:hypothetical protein
MRERGHDHPDPECIGPEGDEGGGAEEQLRRALEQERHRTAARRFFEAAPLYRVEFEEDGTVSLRKKAYAYWPNLPPAAATRWNVLSIHPDLEQAERRLRHITSPHVYYDERGRLVRTPMPGEADAEAPSTPWQR